MKTRKTASKFTAILTLLCAILLWQISAIAQTRIIELTADKDNIFKVVGSKKPIITAKPGEVLKLKITSYKGKEADRDGAVHSLTIKELKDQGWDIRLFEGTKTYTLVAPDKPGEYTFECTLKCGPGHDEMAGKLIVK